jgi:short-subunit dehydrogenase
MADGVDVRQFMDINYYGCVYPTIAALPHLQATAGRICVVSSLGGLMPFPRQTLYNASKYALIGFFDTLRIELLAKKSNVSITMVCPGFVKTGITSGGGIGRDGKQIGFQLKFLIRERNNNV